MLNRRKNLGLAVTEHGVTAVHVGSSTAHTASLTFSDKLNLDAPESLGRELRKVLRQAGLNGSRCVVGLAASWIATRDKVLPAADVETLQGALAIAAERDFASGAQELAFDYCGLSVREQVGGKEASALLVAAPHKVIEQVLAMAKAAGLVVASVTSSAIALACRTIGVVPSGGRLVLCLTPDGAEAAFQTSDGVRMVRRLPVRLDSHESQSAGVDELCSQLRRVRFDRLASDSAGAGRELLIWNAAGLDDGRLASLGANLGMSARVCRLGVDLDVGGSTALQQGQFAPAAALAQAAADSPVIDFLHSRLAVSRKARIGKWGRWGIAAAGLVVAVGVFMYFDWRGNQKEIAALQAQMSGLKASADQAGQLVDGMSFSRGWFDRRPRLLDVLLRIDQAFPQEGIIWVKNLRIRESGEVDLTGEATSETAVLDVRDRLSRDKALGDIKLSNVHKVGGMSRNVSFIISLKIPGGV